MHILSKSIIFPAFRKIKSCRFILSRTYRISMIESETGLMHAESDRIEALLAFPVFVPLESPDGTDTTATRPTLDWADVPGAESYIVHIETLGGDNVVSETLVTSEFVPPDPLADHSYHRVWFEVFDSVDPAGDVDNAASTRIRPVLFATDADATDAEECHYAVPPAVRPRRAG